MFTRLVLAYFCAYILSAAVSENCRYEFIVSDSPGVSCSGNGSQLSQNKRSNSMLEILGRELIQAESDTQDLEQQANTMASRLTEVEQSMKSFQSLDIVNEIRQITTSSNATIPQKYLNLQNKLLSITQSYQKQSAIQLSVFQEVKKQMAAQQEMLLNHSNHLHAIFTTVNGLQSTETKSESNIKTDQAVSDLAKKVENLESTLITDPPIPDSIKRLTTAVNLIQDVSLSRSLRSRVTSLENQMRDVQAYLNKLKGAIMIGK